MKYFIISVLFACKIALSCAFATQTEQSDVPIREIRGVWLTTVYGLDWPNTTATTASQAKVQQKQLDSMLDKLADANFNTIFLQVRLRGDLIYPSAIEPMSSVFSGRTDVSPSYDPLQYAIQAIHKRGMECHAWFVTFPLGTDKTVRSLGKKSIVRKNPKICIKHNHEWLLNPSHPETANYLSSLVNELVKKYDIDGIHFDYIRYPEQAKTFNDKALFRKYGNGQSLDDWRRQNINNLVFRLYGEVKQLKPWVQVSSSPLGKYNRIEAHPNAGWTAYESVYQDAQYWLAEGKHDMVVPMMYYQDRDYYPFVDNWMENMNDRPFVSGLGVYRMEKHEGDWSKQDIINQMDYLRKVKSTGVTFFRGEHLFDDHKGIFSEIVENYFLYPAKLFPLEWINNRQPCSPEQPRVEQDGDFLKLTWQKPSGEKEDLRYTVYYAQSDVLQAHLAKNILATGIHDTVVRLPINPEVEQIYTFSITSSTRYHIESPHSQEAFYYHTPLLK